MNQRNEALIGEFFFAAIGDGHFRRALHGDIAVVRSEVVNRQPFHQAASFHAAHRDTHPVFREGIRHTADQRICRIHPKIFGVIAAVHALFIVEGFHGLGVFPVG
jgi:hypothetical protein